MSSETPNSSEFINSINQIWMVEGLNNQESHQTQTHHFSNKKHKPYFDQSHFLQNKFVELLGQSYDEVYQFLEDELGKEKKSLHKEFRRERSNSSETRILRRRSSMRKSFFKKEKSPLNQDLQHRIGAPLYELLITLITLNPQKNHPSNDNPPSPRGNEDKNTSVSSVSLSPVPLRRLQRSISVGDCESKVFKGSQDREITNDHHIEGETEPNIMAYKKIEDLLAKNGKDPEELVAVLDSFYTKEFSITKKTEEHKKPVILPRYDDCKLLMEIGLPQTSSSSSGPERGSGSERGGSYIGTRTTSSSGRFGIFDHEPRIKKKDLSASPHFSPNHTLTSSSIPGGLNSVPHSSSTPISSNSSSSSGPTSPSPMRFLMRMKSDVHIKFSERSNSVDFSSLPSASISNHHVTPLNSSSPSTPLNSSIDRSPQTLKSEHHSHSPHPPQSFHSHHYHIHHNDRSPQLSPFSQRKKSHSHSQLVMKQTPSPPSKFKWIQDWNENVHSISSPAVGWVAEIGRYPSDSDEDKYKTDQIIEEEQLDGDKEQRSDTTNIQREKEQEREREREREKQKQKEEEIKMKKKLFGDGKYENLEWSCSELEIQDREKDIPFYREYFFGKEHVNYLGVDSSHHPMLISIETKIRDREHERENLTCKTIIRTSEGTERLLLPTKFSDKDALKTLKSLRPQLSDAKLHKITEPELAQELLIIESKEIVTQYKFGILYRKKDQTDEDDMFANVSTSPEFNEFLEFIGTKIELMGWKHFRGGLDVKSNSTGIYSVYTTYREFEIMYHVAPLLPYFPNDKQQLERKRHLGNDIVVIVFMDDPTPYSPLTIKSEFNHVIVLISPLMKYGKRHYQVQIVAKSEVPPFGPILLQPSIYEKSQYTREMILTKLINAERASLLAPVFTSKLQRTRNLQLKAMLQKYHK